MISLLEITKVSRYIGGSLLNILDLGNNINLNIPSERVSVEKGLPCPVPRSSDDMMKNGY